MSEFLSALKADIQYAAPQKLLTKTAGFFAGSRMGPVTTFAIKRFISHYHVDMSECEKQDPAQYATFNEFFTRPLRAARSIRIRARCSAPLTARRAPRGR